jgi:hypothetical protein
VWSRWMLLYSGLPDPKRRETEVNISMIVHGFEEGWEQDSPRWYSIARSVYSLPEGAVVGAYSTAVSETSVSETSVCPSSREVGVPGGVAGRDCLVGTRGAVEQTEEV